VVPEERQWQSAPVVEVSSANHRALQEQLTDGPNGSQAARVLRVGDPRGAGRRVADIRRINAWAGLWLHSGQNGAFRRSIEIHQTQFRGPSVNLIPPGRFIEQVCGLDR
jgi:hypothetical protein